MTDETRPPADVAARGFIWSDEHNAYWRPNGGGYTIRISGAGVYDRSYFDRIVRGVGPEKKLKFEPFPAGWRELSEPLSRGVVMGAELRALIARATAEELTDDGRYFRETCDDLTRCRHEEIGEYQHSADGPLVEWLWNRRHEIAALYETAGQTEVNDSGKR